MDWFFTWSGECVGYRYLNDLWSHDGRHIGCFHGNELYAPDGCYLGEAMGDRLVTDVEKKSQSIDPFPAEPNRVSYLKRENKRAMALPDGHEDFSG